MRLISPLSALRGPSGPSAAAGEGCAAKASTPGRARVDATEDQRRHRLGLVAHGERGGDPRAERVVLLSAPQAFFGLALNGWVLAIIINLLTIAAWITVVQRMKYVYDMTTPKQNPEDQETNDYRLWDRPSRRDTAARPVLKGE